MTDYDRHKASVRRLIGTSTRRRRQRVAASPSGIRRGHGTGVACPSPPIRFIARCHRSNDGEHCKQTERHTASERANCFCDRISQNTYTRRRLWNCRMHLHCMGRTSQCLDVTSSYCMATYPRGRIRFPLHARPSSAAQSRYYVASYNGAACSAKAGQRATTPRHRPARPGRRYPVVQLLSHMRGIGASYF